MRIRSTVTFPEYSRQSKMQNNVRRILKMINVTNGIGYPRNTQNRVLSIRRLRVRSSVVYFIVVGSYVVDEKKKTTV